MSKEQGNKEAASKRSAKDQYVAEARGWEADRIQRETRSRGVAWIVAGVAVVLALAMALALATLVPLKQTEPYLVRVEKSSGITDVLTKVEDVEQIPAKKAVARYWLAKYIRLREGYFYPTLKEDYEKVMILSAGSAEKAYAQYFNPKGNPDSPVTKYKDRLQNDVAINSISFIEQGVASIRFTKHSQLQGEKNQISEWVATVDYSFNPNRQLSSDERQRNPLGFTVTRYRVDPETVGGS